MAIMRIQFRTIHIDLTPSLKTYCEEKFSHIEKLLKHIDPDGASELDLELVRTTSHHHKGEVFEAEVHLKMPGKIFRVSETGSDMRAAVDKLKDKLHISVERYKDFFTKTHR